MLCHVCWSQVEYKIICFISASSLHDSEFDVIKNISRNLFPLLVELPLRVVVTILECCVTFAGVKLSIRSFVLFLQAAFMIQNLMS